MSARNGTTLFFFLLIALSSVIVAILLVLGKKDGPAIASGAGTWSAPDTSTIPHSAEGDKIRYGRELISRTAVFLGPNGSVGSFSNAMNCQNCHMDAGTKPYGNNFARVASTYPAFRPRSGKIESVSFRINDCFQRSMNGKSLDTTSREMLAMSAYILWIGKDVENGSKPAGSGSVELPWLSRSADVVRGKIIYQNNCRVCHGKNGEGLHAARSEGFMYPPLWGDESYNTGAGLLRLGRFAGFVKYNMPQGTTYKNPVLTDEEAWDVAAFVNSQNRPNKFFPRDWPDKTLKAVDYPFGPFADRYSAKQHKYGPYGPIRRALDSLRQRR